MRKMLIAIIVSAPATLFAQGHPSYQCTMGDLTRRVEVMHETGVSVPCEVHYYKDTEAPGVQQVLWRAMSEEGYCEAKATEFIAKLSGMGWNCAESSAMNEDAGMDDDDAEMTDDTDTLAPAEEDIELPDPEND